MKSGPVSQPELLDFRATILLIVAAFGLSVKKFQDMDLSFLMMDYQAWPQEPWRLFTACLLHGSILHLVFNLFWTWRFGVILEPIFGLWATLGIYLFLGFGSSAAQWAFSGGGIGLSGIGYGMFGLLWALDRFHPNFRGVMGRRTIDLFVLWFFFCLVITYMDLMPIGNVAHGSGALLGGLVGLSLSPFEKRRLVGMFGTSLATIVIALCATVGRPYVNFSGQVTWELQREGFRAIQAEDYPRALEHFELARDRDDTSAYTWNALAFLYYQLERGEEYREAQRRANLLSATGIEQPLLPFLERLRNLGPEEGR